MKAGPRELKLREQREAKFEKPKGLRISSLKTSEPVGDGVALTSIAHPPGLIEKMADAIKTGKLSLAKATKGKAGTAGVKGPVRRSTTGTGLQVGEAVAVQPAREAAPKRGRPPKPDGAPVSRATQYRRKAEGKKP